MGIRSGAGPGFSFRVSACHARITGPGAHLEAWFSRVSLGGHDAYLMGRAKILRDMLSWILTLFKIELAYSAATCNPE